MRVATKKLGLVSGERIRDELFKCLAVPNFEAAIELSGEFGVLDQLRLLIFGEDPVESQSQGQSSKLLAAMTGLKKSLLDLENKDKSQLKLILGEKHLETYQAMLEEPLQGGRKRGQLFLLCSLTLHIHPLFDAVQSGEVHLFPSVFSEQIVQALLTGQKEKAYFQAVSGGFLRLADLSASRPGKLDYYRFFRDFGSYGLDSALLAMVEGETRDDKFHFTPEILQEVFYTWFEEHAQVVNPPRLVDGSQLQRELSVGPGSHIGRLLESIREQQVLGKVNTTTEAIAYARAEYERNGKHDCTST
jgi:hypothetical protein